MKSEKSIIDLASIQFIFRHVWYFLYPIVIIYSAIAGASSSNIILQYKCSSILSFETTGGTVIDSKFIAKKTDLIGRVLLGENIRSIVKIVWPHIDDNADPSGYNALIESLRNPKSGIILSYDKKDPRLISISFISSNPEICYKVVRATIATIEKANREVSAKELETGMVFLRKQVEFYHNKITAIDEEISKIKGELKEKSSELSGKERDLIEEMIGGIEGRDIVDTGLSISAQKAVKYEEMSADLNLQLLEAQRKKEDIEKQLKTGVFVKQLYSAQAIEEDAFVKEYSRAVAAKELEIANLLSRGYMREHPHVIRLQKEIEELGSLKAKRIEELTGAISQDVSDSVKKQQEETLKASLKDIGFQIETLNDKIALMEKYKKGSVDQRVELKRVDVSVLASRLTELRGEKSISTMYYTDLRKQLEAAEIKSRLQKEELFTIRIVEEPVIPFRPMPFQTAPKILMGLMMAIAMGTGLAYIVDTLDNSVKNSSELRELLQVPVLASIDKIYTPQEIRAKQVQRSASAIGLIALGILSALAGKLGMLKFIFK